MPYLVSGAPDTRFIAGPPSNPEEGSGYTPDYVHEWLGPWLDGNRNVRLPATLAAGIADGRIPADAIDYSTGNAGGAFADYDAWIAAQVAQDKPGALGVDIAPGTITASKLMRGLYGYGEAMPKITSPSRLSARLTTYRHDITIRGIEFVNFGWFLRHSRKQVPLTIASVYDTNPYNSGSDATYVNTTGSTIFTEKVGHIDVVDAPDITNIFIKRRVDGAVPPTVAAWDGAGGWNESFEGYPSSYPALLASPITGATAATLAAGINAHGGTSGFVAEAIGSRVHLYAPTVYIEPLAMVATVTGGGSLVLACEMCGVDVSCCKFTDVNCFMGGISETTPLGPLRAFKNVGLGSWGLMSFHHLRRTYVRVANNEQSDALLTRPTAPGRTNSRMPSGGNTNAYNTVVFMGSNTFSLAAFGFSDERYEHNYFHDMESANNTDTNNCAVGLDIRSNAEDFYLDATLGGHLEVSWNKLVNLVGLTGAIDCNGIYGKPRGGTFKRNWIENCGAAWFSTSFTGSEASGILMKEGRAGAGMPALIVEGNTVLNPPNGCPVIKVDNQWVLEVSYNLIQNWRNEKNGDTQTDGATSGAMRITGDVDLAGIFSNRFVNVAMLGQPMGINLHNIDNHSGAGELEISNNEFENDGSVDYPEYTAGTTVMRYNFGGGDAIPDPAAFFNAALMGYNVVKDANGDVVGDADLIYTNNSTLYDGSANATLKPFADYDPLA